MGLLLPVLLLSVVVLVGQPTTGDPVPETTLPLPQPEPQPMVLTVLSGENSRQMELETYITAVVLGEMPASFETDALRAQAVAARTYTLKRCIEGHRHGANTICTDYTCCQAYKDPSDYISEGGSPEAVEKVRQAVADTDGEVLVYDGSLIVATYFSCAGDATEDAVAVWGEDYPYLRSVDSPGEQDAVYYTDSKCFTPEQLTTALELPLEGAVESWFGQISYTSGGGVDTMVIGGKTFRGTQLRSLLELRSAAFTVSVENGQILFRTKGFGHRVGMSQYGANAMAKSGKDYRQILTHYYTGVRIVQYGYE